MPSPLQSPRSSQCPSPNIFTPRRPRWTSANLPTPSPPQCPTPKASKPWAVYQQPSWFATPTGDDAPQLIFLHRANRVPLVTSQKSSISVCIITFDTRQIDLICWHDRTLSKLLDNFSAFHLMSSSSFLRSLMTTNLYGLIQRRGQPFTMLLPRSGSKLLMRPQAVLKKCILLRTVPSRMVWARRRLMSHVRMWGRRHPGVHVRQLSVLEPAGSWGTVYSCAP